MSQNNIDAWLAQADGIQITPAQMEELVSFVEQEYPSDPMMQELRMIRNFRVLRRGMSVEELLNDYRRAA